MSVYGTANRLAREIKKSDEYTKYQEIRKKVMENETTKQMLQDFQRQQMQMQSKQMTGQELTDEEKEKMENLRKIIDLNQDVKEYLQAEYRMSVMLNDLQRILFGELEIGVFEEKDSDSEDSEDSEDNEDNEDNEDEEETE